MPGVTWVIAAVVLLTVIAVFAMGIFGILLFPVLLALWAIFGLTIGRRRAELQSLPPEARRRAGVRDVEPTGAPRKASSGAGTANERVGQE